MDYPSIAPADPNTDPRRYPRFWFRFFEVLPGAVVWTALIVPFILSLLVPLWVTIFVVLFDVYWLLRSLSFGEILLRGHRRFRQVLSVNWLAKLKELDSLSPSDLKELDMPNWRHLFHAVIIATYKEDISILEESIESLLHADYPQDRMMVVLATEERDAKNARQIGAQLKEKYRHQFADFLVTEHPDDILGEVKAKGANVTWAAKELVRTVEQQGIDFDHVLVSTADADSRFHPQYFSRLTYCYLTTPDRTQACYQPVAIFLNNIWQANMLARVMAFSTTFWQLIESIRDYRLVTFSTHSTSLKTLKETGYWSTSIVNEDSRQFFRAFFYYHGQFRVIPLFMPIYMDAVHVETRWGTLKNLYFQQQRWAYGAEHFPYIVMESLHHKEIPRSFRFAWCFRAFSGSFSWATSAFFLTVVGWLPLLLNPSFQQQVAASSFPLVTKLLLSLTWLGLFISSYVTLRLLVTLSPGRRTADFFTMVVQWITVPIASILFGALPGIDALTRLMFGRYIGFRVTQKAKHT